jgi:hypothetical protein
MNTNRTAMNESLYASFHCGIEHVPGSVGIRFHQLFTLEPSVPVSSSEVIDDIDAVRRSL